MRQRLKDSKKKLLTLNFKLQTKIYCLISTLQTFNFKNF